MVQEQDSHLEFNKELLSFETNNSEIDLNAVSSNICKWCNTGTRSTLSV